MSVSVQEQQSAPTIFASTDYCEGFWSFCYQRRNSRTGDGIPLIRTLPLDAWIRTEVLAVVTRDCDAAGAPLTVTSRIRHCGDDNPAGVSDTKEAFRDTFTHCSVDDLKAVYTKLFKSIMANSVQLCRENRFLPDPQFIPVQGREQKLVATLRKIGLTVTAVP